CARTQSNFDYW
nr:immunoglobulin heavy chain junction region [Macaca mulatta]